MTDKIKELMDDIDLCAIIDENKGLSFVDDLLVLIESMREFVDDFIWDRYFCPTRDFFSFLCDINAAYGFVKDEKYDCFLRMNYFINSDVEKGNIKVENLLKLKEGVNECCLKFFGTGWIDEKYEYLRQFDYDGIVDVFNKMQKELMNEPFISEVKEVRKFDYDKIVDTFGEMREALRDDE